jgi:hypothetical protein
LRSLRSRHRQVDVLLRRQHRREAGHAGARTTVAWADPESLGPGPFCGGFCQIGGSWSSYWYNNFVDEWDITRGLQVYRVSDRVTAGAIKLDRLNPQTQEFSLP